MKTGKKDTGKKRMGMSIKNKLTYQELIDLYAKECKLKNLADVTIQGYLYANKYFLEYVKKDLLCADVTQDLIDDYKLHLMSYLKPQTVNSYIFKVSPIVKYGISKGYIEDNIMFTHMVEQEHFKKIYTDEELSILLKKPKTNSFAEFRCWVIVNFLLATGVRATELREININDLDLDNGIVSLSHTKNRKPRVIPIPTTLQTILQEYLLHRQGQDNEPLFCNQYGEKLCRTTLQTSITKYAKRRGLNRYSLHLFRHTFITLSIKKGVSPIILKRITGHSNFKMLDNYFNANIDDIVSIVDNINPLEDFKSKKKLEMKTSLKMK